MAIFNKNRWRFFPENTPKYANPHFRTSPTPVACPRPGFLCSKWSLGGLDPEKNRNYRFRSLMTGIFHEIQWILPQNSPRIPKSAHRDVADARDGPGSPTVALYVGFGCVRLREKSKMRISGSHDGDFRQNNGNVCLKYPKISKSALRDVADASDGPGD